MVLDDDTNWQWSGIAPAERRRAKDAIIQFVDSERDEDWEQVESNGSGIMIPMALAMLANPKGGAKGGIEHAGHLLGRVDPNGTVLQLAALLDGRMHIPACQALLKSGEASGRTASGIDTLYDWKEFDVAMGVFYAVEDIMGEYRSAHPWPEKFEPPWLVEIERIARNYRPLSERNRQNSQLMDYGKGLLQVIVRLSN